MKSGQFVILAFTVIGATALSDDKIKVKMGGAAGQVHKMFTEYEEEPTTEAPRKQAQRPVAQGAQAKAQVEPAPETAYIFATDHISFPGISDSLEKAKGLVTNLLKSKATEISDKCLSLSFHYEQTYAGGPWQVNVVLKCLPRPPEQLRLTTKYRQCDEISIIPAEKWTEGLVLKWKAHKCEDERVGPEELPPTKFQSITTLTTTVI